MYTIVLVVWAFGNMVVEDVGLYDSADRCMMVAEQLSNKVADADGESVAICIPTDVVRAEPHEEHDQA